MKLPSREKQVLLAKLACSLYLEALMAPPLLGATVLLGRAPEPLLRLQNQLRQRTLGWMFPGLRAE